MSGRTGPLHVYEQASQHQLEETGVLVILRQKKRTTGDTWWKKSLHGSSQGDVKIEQVEAVDIREDDILAEFVGFSGFDSVEEWRNAFLERLSTPEPEAHLFRVEERAEATASD